MLIKSPFKDYYDFLQGKYGIDTKVVYERIQEVQQHEGYWGKPGMYRPDHLDFKTYFFYRIAFCGTIYCIWVNNQKFYMGDEVLSLDNKDVDLSYRSSLSIDKSTSLQHHGKKTPLNNKLNCPVVLIKYNGDIKNVKLQDFNFAKLVSPEDAYTKIYDFLIREPVIKDNRTNIEKVVSAGFDKKTSFRNM